MPRSIEGKITEKLETNVIYGANQEDKYRTLPAHKTKTGIAAFAFELSDEEVEKVAKNKKIYVSLLTFNNPIQPICVCVAPEYLDENVEFNDNMIKQEIVKLSKNKKGE